MSILGTLALISEAKAAMALFSAGLAGASVVASDIYAGVKSGLQQRRQRKLENQFDGLLDTQGGGTVGAIKSTFALLGTFDAFVGSVSKREKKQAVAISSAGLGVFFFIALMAWQAVGAPTGSATATPTEWSNAAVLPLMLIAVLFVALSNAGAALFVRWSGRAQRYLDVLLSVAPQTNSDGMQEGDLLEHDKLSYREVKIDVERRLMSSMIEVLESQNVRSNLAEKRFVKASAEPDEKDEMKGWIEPAREVLTQFPQLQAIKRILPHVLKQAKATGGKGLIYNIDAIDRFHTLGFENGTLKTVQIRSVPGFCPPRKGLFGWLQRQKTVDDWRSENTDFDLRDRGLYCAY